MIKFDIEALSELCVKICRETESCPLVLLQTNTKCDFDCKTKPDKDYFTRILNDQKIWLSSPINKEIIYQ